MELPNRHGLCEDGLLAHSSRERAIAGAMTQNKIA